MIRPRKNILITFECHDNHETNVVNPRVNVLVLTLDLLVKAQSVCGE